MENLEVVDKSWKLIGLEEDGYDDKRPTWEILIVLELFSILIVVIDKWVYSDNKNYIGHIHK